MKNKTIKDATLSEYRMFFTQNISGVSCRPHFEKWLNTYRFEKTLRDYDRSVDRYEEANRKWLRVIKKSEKAETLDEKIELMKKAEKYKTIMDKEEELQRKLDKQLM